VFSRLEQHDTWNRNGIKTKIMVFEKRGASNTEIYFGSKRLEVVSSFKYLGLEFFKNGNWSRSCSMCITHAVYIILERVDMKVSDMVQLLLVPLYCMHRRCGAFMKPTIWTLFKISFVENY
jgi:hypothetical protein